MKNILFTFFLFFAFQLSKAQSKNYLSIYVDQSTSVTIDKKKLTKYLRHYMVGYLEGKNSATVDVKLIFENTASMTNTTVFEFNVPQFQPELYSEEKRGIQRKLHKAQVQQYKLVFITKLVNFITHLKGTAKSTEILEMLVPLSRLKHPSTVLVISDMIQESAIANLTKEKIENEAQIIAVAHKNIKTLKQKYVLSDSLKETSITCVIPVSQGSKNVLYRFLETYWTTVYTSFGITVNFQKI